VEHKGQEEVLELLKKMAKKRFQTSSHVGIVISFTFLMMKARNSLMETNLFVHSFALKSMLV
jgi:hypothetical protein